MLNWNLISHPVNWLTVFLMVMITAIFVHFALTHITSSGVQSQG